MRWYRELPHSSDALMEAYGRTLAEAFANAARAMMSVMLDVRRVRGSVEGSCELEGEDAEGLLYGWLECVLDRFQVERVAYARFSVDLDEGRWRLRASMRGEHYDPSRHGMGREVKAVTYHMMYVGECGGLRCVRFLLDL
ncbi:MAG: archease [Nitrososphaeria archaeon]